MTKYSMCLHEKDRGGNVDFCEAYRTGLLEKRQGVFTRTESTLRAQHETEKMDNDREVWGGKLSTVFCAREGSLELTRSPTRRWRAL